jgi:serine/threonine protein kinase
MEKAPHQSSEVRKKFKEIPLENYFALHLDIKPENIMIDDDGEVRKYPKIFLGDWGLAKYAAATDDGNPVMFCMSGTHGYFTPEQLAVHPEQKLFENFKEPPVRNDDQVTSALNIYNIAKVVFDIMQQYQDEPHEGEMTYAGEVVENIIKGLTEKEYLANGSHWLDANYVAEREPDYSQELKNLLRNCLDPNPERRLSRFEVACLADEWLKQHDTEDTLDQNAVHYRQEDFSKMPFGKEKLASTDYVYERLRQHYDPEHPFVLPREKRASLQQKMNWGRPAMQITGQVRVRSDGDPDVGEFIKDLPEIDDDSDDTDYGGKNNNVEGG